ncbi:MAG: sodium:proton antiporter [Bacteroidota bacterium]|nr:sodium:proton antiporter [Bacteroidota bacterium]
MTITILITLSGLLLIAYIFDLTSALTKIPSVLLLLLLGWLVREVSQFMEVTIPDLTRFLPLLGTMGLILIVLEGSLELGFDKTKKKVITKSFLVALLPMLAMAFLLAFMFSYFDPNVSFKLSLTNAIPFCVISSAVAISSVKNLAAKDSEFIIYESSFSDILGVLFFNYIALNSVINIHSAGRFTIQLLIIALISFIATLGLSFLLSKIEHPIKFVPIILLVILIYAISEIYHLPALIFILLFGLFLGNLEELKQFKWIQILRPRELTKEVHKFKELIVEITFLIRALFFLLFGYLMKKSEILNPESIIWAVGIVAAIFLFRAIFLRSLKLPLSPLLFIAPRGLITILLFLAIDTTQTIPLVSTSLVIQVIILTALVMMVGLMGAKGKDEIAKKEEKLVT